MQGNAQMERAARYERQSKKDMMANRLAWRTKTNLNQDTPQHKTIMKRKHANPKSTFIFAAHMQNMITRWWMPCAATLFHSLNGPNGPCAARLLPVCSPHSRNKFARQDPVICGWMPNERHMPERPAITRLDAADRQKTTYSSKNFCSHRGCCRCKVLRARLGILPNGCWKPFITSTRRRAAPDRPLWCITWQTWSWHTTCNGLPRMGKWMRAER